MRKILMLGVLVLAGCRGDDVGRLQPGEAVTVVAPEPKLAFAPGSLAYETGNVLVEAGARAMVMLDDDEEDGPGRPITVRVKATDLMDADQIKDSSALVILRRSCLRPD